MEATAPIGAVSGGEHGGGGGVGVPLIKPIDNGVHKGASSSSASTAARKGVITQMPPAGAVDQSQLSRPHHRSPLAPASRRVGERGSDGGGMKGKMEM